MAKVASAMPPYIAHLHQHDLKVAQRVALLMAPRLGDTLLMMTMANNLIKNGREVTVFGGYAYMLRDWFPHIDIRPALNETEAKSVLSNYDCAAQMHVGWPYALHDYAATYFYYDAHVVVTGKGFVKVGQINDFCKNELSLQHCSIDNGLVPLPGLCHRKHEKRVAIHSSSTGAQRCWDPAHFVELAQRLQQLGYSPVFILAEHERKDWTCLDDNNLPIFQSVSLSDVAAFVYECGWFIGNESGVGHLASNVGISTLTLTGRPTRTRAWRPGWSLASIVYPAYIPGGRLRDRLWRSWLQPSQVIRAFLRLTAKGS